MSKPIVIFTIGTQGDIRPCVALGQGLHRAGYPVRIATSANFAELVRQGQRTGAVGADVDPDDAAALVVAASDGLQVQWLLDPEAVDVHRVLRLLEQLVSGRVSVDAAGREPSR